MLAKAYNPKSLRRVVVIAAMAALVFGIALPLSLGRLLGPGVTVPTASPHMPDFGKLPLSFEPNAGQTDPSVRFMAHASGGTLYFTPSGVALALKEESGAGSRGPNCRKSKIVRMQFVDANPSPQMVGGEGLPGKVNYFLGNDPSKWHTDLPTYSGVVYKELYPGVDLSYEGTGGSLKGTYTIAPGADPSRIRWRYEGAEKVWVDEKGNLQIRLAGAVGASEAVTVTEQVPVAWQEVGGTRVTVNVRYETDFDGNIGFASSKYDKSHPLTLDPTLIYSTYLGGSNDDLGEAIAADAAGNAYVTGYTGSDNFPLANAYQPVLHGTDAFVTKLNSAGTALVYSTYLGGTNTEVGESIAVDGAGNAYITGYTSSTDFPTVNAIQPLYGGGSNDALITKLDANGASLLYSTYLGGTGNDYGSHIVVDQANRAYIVGSTGSNDFPTRNAFQPVCGGSCGGYFDAFVTKINAAGSALVYSTYLGGGLGGEEGLGIAVDQANNVYVTGVTFSPDFPTQNAFQPVCGSRSPPANCGLGDAFVTKLNPTGNGLVYSTFLGGTGNDRGYGIAVDGGSNAYVTGYTRSSGDFPLQNPFQPILAGGIGDYDAFITKLNPTGSGLVYSTYFRGDFS